METIIYRMYMRNLGYDILAKFDFLGELLRENHAVT